MLAKPNVVCTPEGYLHLEWHTSSVDLVLEVWGASYDYRFHHDGVDMNEVGALVGVGDANVLWPYILSIGEER